MNIEKRREFQENFMELTDWLTVHAPGYYISTNLTIDKGELDFLSISVYDRRIEGKLENVSINNYMWNIGQGKNTEQTFENLKKKISEDITAHLAPTRERIETELKDIKNREKELKGLLKSYEEPF